MGGASLQTISAATFFGFARPTVTPSLEAPDPAALGYGAGETRAPDGTSPEAVDQVVGAGAFELASAADAPGRSFALPLSPRDGADGGVPSERPALQIMPEVAGAVDGGAPTPVAITVKAEPAPAEAEPTTPGGPVLAPVEAPARVTAPADADANPDSVAESAAVGSAVGIIARAIDANASDSVSYALSDDAGGLFTIDAATGVVRVAGALDYEAAASHEIEVVARSSDGSTARTRFTIVVTDAAEHIRLPDGGATFADLDTPELSVTGGDGDDRITGSAVGDSLAGGGGDDVLDGGDGDDLLDGGASDDTLTGGRGADTLLGGDGMDVLDGGDDDDRLDGGASDDTLTGGRGADTLLGGDGVDVAVYSGDWRDYTVSYDAATGAYTLTDRRGDGGVDVVSGVEVFRFADGDVALADLPNDAPTGVTLMGGLIGEDAAPGTLAGTARAVDADAHDAHRYSLDDDAGGRFVIDADTGDIRVAPGVALDREAAAGHDLVVRVTDAAGASATSVVTIRLADVDEFDITAPVDADPVPDTLAEDAAAGTSVGIAAAARDADAEDSVTYALTDDAGGRFTIDAATGVVSVVGGLDFETAASHGIEVQARSTDGSTAATRFTVAVTDAAETLRLGDGGVTFTDTGVAENAIIGGDGADVITGHDDGARIDGGAGDDAITGGDGDDSLSGDAGADSLDGGVGDDRLDGGDGADTAVWAGGLSDFSVVWNAAAQTFTITDLNTGDGLDEGVDTVAGVETFAFNGVTYTAAEMRHVAALQANSAPTAPTSTGNTVAENAAVGVIAATLASTDADGDAIAYVITDAAGIPVADGDFEIVGNELRVKQGARLDFETAPTRTLHVKAADTLEESAPTRITISVTDAAETLQLADGGVRFTDTGVAEDAIIGGDGADVITGHDGGAGIDGGAGDDAITGGLGDDSLIGGAGADAIEGGAGRDIILGGGGRDRIAGGDGNDQIAGGADDDTLDGGGGDDNLGGGQGADVLLGGAGTDRLRGEAGDDTLDGGDGVDTAVFLWGIGEYDIVEQPGGALKITDRRGIEGSDTVSNVELFDFNGVAYTLAEVRREAALQANAAPTAPTSTGNAVAENAAAGVVAATLASTDADGDAIAYVITDAAGSPVADADFEIVGNELRVKQGARLDFETAPTRTLHVKAADTLEESAPTRITIAVTDAAETLQLADGGVSFTDAGVAETLITGGSGADTITANASGGTIDGAGGADLIVGGVGGDTLRGGAGNDRLLGGAGADNLQGDDGADLLDGGDGDDSLRGGAGNDRLYGGAGADTLQGDDGVDLIFGDTGDDSITAGAGVDTIFGGDGADHVDAGNDADFVSGGAGNDTLLGGAGADTILGGAGDNQLSGGADRDLIVVDESGGVGAVDGGETGTDGDTLSLTGTSAASIVFTGAEAGGYAIGAGRGVFTGIEAVEGAGGDDTLDASAAAGAVTLSGDAGDDSLIGGAGDDLIRGDAAHIRSGDGEMLTNPGLEIGSAPLVWQNSVVAGWQSASGTLEVWGSGIQLQSWLQLHTPDGSDMIELDQSSTRQDSIWQDVTTTAGTDYIIAIEATDRFHWFSDTAEVWFGGQMVGVLDPGGWGVHTFEVTGAGGAERLEIREIGSQNDGFGVVINTISMRAAGDDTLTGGAGRDTLEGDGGTDTAVWKGDLADFSVVWDAASATFTVTDQKAADGLDEGIDTVRDVERFVFNGVTYTAAQMQHVAALQANAAPTAPTSTGNAVAENAAAGVVAATLASTDADGDAIAYVITDAAGNPVTDADFEIVGNELRVKQGARLDFETAATRTLRVKAADALEESAPTQITIAVGDVAEIIQLADGGASFTDLSVSETEVRGGSGDDTIVGAAGDDNIVGGAGDDNVNGGLGADRMLGGDGADTLEGMWGNDLLDGGAGDDSLLGSASNDTLLGGDGADYLHGGNNDDSLVGGAGNDAIDGGTGADTVRYDGDLADFSVAWDGLRFTIADLNASDGDEGVDTVRNVETFIFNGVSYTAAQMQHVAALQANAAPTAPTSTGNAVAENAAAGVVAATLASTDADGDAIAYVITDAAGSPVADADFEIVGNELRVKQGARLDFETAPTRTLHVKAADTLEESAPTQITIAVNDAGEGIVLADGGAAFDDVGVAESWITGGDGADTIVAHASGGSTLYGLSGDDALSGRDGADTIWGGAGADRIDGGAGNDSLGGDEGNDIVSGGAGADTLWGGGGADTLDGGAGDDVLGGDAGHDAISGGSGADTIWGGDGADVIEGGAGDDALEGGADSDVAVWAGDLADFSVVWNAGASAFTITDRNAADGLDEGADTVTGVETFSFNGVSYSAAQMRQVAELQANDAPTAPVSSGNTAPENATAGTVAATLSSTDANGDAISYVITDASGNPVTDADFEIVGNELRVKQGAALDYETTPSRTLHVKAADALEESAPTQITIAIGDVAEALQLADGGVSFTDAGVAETSITGGSGADTIIANAAGGTIDGGAGADTITGGAGHDTLRGGDGDDSLAAGEGNDWLIGGAGNDTLDGGGWWDTVDYRADAAGVSVNLATGVATGASIGTDTLVRIERVLTGTGDDILIGSAGNDQFESTGGNNLIDGGGSGDDQFYMLGQGHDTMIAGSGNERLFGGWGHDLVDYRNATSGVAVDLGLDDWQNTGGSGVDWLNGIENLAGSGHGDALSGDDWANRLDGAAGDDTLTGKGGDDVITGGDGTDVAVWAGDLADFSVVWNAAASAFLITDRNTVGALDEGLDTVTGVETFIFNGVAYTAAEMQHVAALQANAAPTAPTSTGNAVAENAAAGVVAATLASTDADGDAIAYVITDAAGNPVTDADFEIVGNELRVKQGARLDFETAPTRTLHVKAADALEESAPTQITIAVGDSREVIQLADGGVSFTDAGVAEISITGGSGGDAITANAAGGTIIDGAAGNDTLTGGLGADTLAGGDGADLIAGGDGADLIEGGAGDDVIYYGAGQDTVLGGDGADFIDDAPGYDATANGSILYGGAGNDTLFGGAGADTLFGDADDDVLSGESGDDALSGGAGNDTIDGGDGDDSLYGDVGNDSLTGGAGNDRLEGESGGDFFDGGDGSDAIHIDDDTNGVDNVIQDSGASGIDTLYLDDGAGSYEVQWNFSQATSGVEIIDGSAQVGETLTSNAAAINFDLTGITLIGVDRIDGTSGNDTIVGSAGDDYLDGDTGDDILRGGAGDDTIEAHNGADTVDGGEGSDLILLGTFSGGAGVSKTIVDTGATGTDTIRLDQGAGDYEVQGRFSAATSGIEIIDGSTATGEMLTTDDMVANFDFTGITLIGVDQIAGTGGADTIVGSAGDDSIDGGAGDDILRGGAGDDTLDGGAGTDAAFWAGSLSDYALAWDGGTRTFTIVDRNVADGLNEGTDRVTNVESFAFAGATYTAADLQTEIARRANDAPTDVTFANGATAFAAEAVARFDNLAGGWFQRVFDHAVTANQTPHNVWLGQEGKTSNMMFEVVDGAGVKHRIVAANAIVQGETATWRAEVTDTGVMRIYKNGALAAQGQGIVPANVERPIQLVGDSNFTADTPLVGEVSRIVVDFDPLAPVSENASVGTVVGMAQGVDADPGDTLSFSLLDDAGGLFAIDAATGRITVAGALDYEAASSHTVRIRVADQWGASHVEDKTILVANESTPLSDLKIAGVQGLAATPEAADVVARMSAVGGEGPITWAITGGAAQAFVIDAETGEIRLRPTGLSFAEQTSGNNPFNGLSAGSHSATAFGDIDGDGDLDAMVGDDRGDVRYFQNTGSASAPVFTNRGNLFAIDISGSDAIAPQLVDIDADGDLDLFLQEDIDELHFFRNTGSATDPRFAEPVRSPFGIADPGNNFRGQFADLDGDGDLDYLTGRSDGSFHYYQNVGTAQAPSFAARVANPFGLFDVGTDAAPTLFDMDNDGDLDLMVATSGGQLRYFLNVGSATAPVFSDRGVQGSLGTGSTGATIADLDGDGDGDVVLSGSTTALRYFENRSTGFWTSTGVQEITLEVTATDAAGQSRMERILFQHGSGAAETIQGDGQDGVIYGGGGNDTLRGEVGDDYLDGGAGNDQLWGGDGADTLAGGAGADSLEGQIGSDVADYSGSNAGVTIRLGEGGDAIGSGGHAQDDTLWGIDDLTGSEFADVLQGYNATYDGRTTSNIIDGRGGNDQIFGMGGNDSLIGGAGDDTLSGGTGNDTLDGGTGNDLLRGDDGSDVFTYGAGDGRDSVQGGAGWTDVIELQGMSGPIAVNGGTVTGAGWTMVLDGGYGIVSAGGGVIDLTADAKGVITFDDGGSLTFQEVERIAY